MEQRFVGHMQEVDPLLSQCSVELRIFCRQSLFGGKLVHIDSESVVQEPPIKALNDEDSQSADFGWVHRVSFPCIEDLATCGFVSEVMSSSTSLAVATVVGRSWCPGPQSCRPLSAPAVLHTALFPDL